MRVASLAVRMSCAAVFLTAGGAAFGGVMGTPLVAIGEGQPMSWSQAMVAPGRLFAVDPAIHGVHQPTRDFYQTQGNAVFVPSHLTPDLMVADGAGEVHQSLVMQWNPLMQGEDMAVAQFELNTFNWGSERVGGLDLRGGMAHFSILAPPGVWDLSFLLIDKEGLACGWFLRMPPPTWQNYWINFGEGDQNGWQKIGQPGFDLSNVVAVRLDEAGAIVQFPPPPQGAPGEFWDWNAFDHLIITPAPGGALMIGVSLLLAGVRRRRTA